MSRPWKCQRPGCENNGVQTTAGSLRKWCSEPCRKAQYGTACIDCGQVHYSGKPRERCDDCWAAHQHLPETRRQRSNASLGWVYWSDQECLDALAACAVDGVVSSTAYREMCARQPGMYPDSLTILNRFDGWANAVELAGFRTKRGRNRHPRSDMVSAEGCILALEDCAADIGHLPSCPTYEKWSSGGRGPASATIRKRLGGSWVAALEAAFPEEMAA